VFFEPGMIDAARASPLGELFRPGNLVNQMRARTGPKATSEGLSFNGSDPPTTEGLSTNSSHPPPRPCSVPSFEVNSEPHTGARPSVCLCVGPELSRCVHIFFRGVRLEHLGAWGWVGRLAAKRHLFRDKRH
jgi:hypothetical protein